MPEPKAGGHYRAMYPSEFLAADELMGRDVLVVIASVSIGELPLAGSSKTERKPVVTFEGKDRKMVLNKTNAKTIAKLYGVITKDWVGKPITLFPTTTKLKGETVECIRIRPTAPKGTKAAAPREPDPTGDGPPRDEDVQEVQP